MKTSNNKILIIGGSAGIGLAIAQSLSVNNQVIITGRNAARLQQAAAKLKNTTAIVSDVSEAADVDRLVSRLYAEHPDLNVVINNAGKAFVYDLTGDGADGFDKAGEEMLTNYLSVIRLNEKLLPLLRRQPEAAIVNVTSIVAFAPGAVLATYSASKAALRSYTQTLRYVLRSTNIKVFELMPPLVDTEFSTGIGGHLGIKPAVVAEELVKALKEDRFEIRVAGTEDLYKVFLNSPEQALEVLNDRESAKAR
ncbi:MAG TPA: SDR family NAD(P)-dependent oxidoreductase [Puia sp.]|nr:SDR family NAD(P)-dependent oxidoreductase [Puia sp.]